MFGLSYQASVSVCLCWTTARLLLLTLLWKDPFLGGRTLLTRSHPQQLDYKHLSEALDG